MSEVLVATNTVGCKHSGTVTPEETSRLRVGNKHVLLASIKGKKVDSCTTQDNIQAGTKQCKTVLSVSAGEKSKLTVGKVSVLLADLQGLSDGVTPPPPPDFNAITAKASQTRLTAAAVAG
jgi:hypothetical protein